MSARRARRNSIASAASGRADGSRNDAIMETHSTSRPAQTSRNSNRADTTQRNTLRELPRIPPRPTTPMRRASSADPISVRPSARQTPAGTNSARRPTGTTPHARAAMREIEMRRAAVLTPGRNRRRSLGRQQKETPMAAMRALSKLLAPQTKPPTPSPLEAAESKTAKRRKIVDDFDDLDAEAPARPRFSMALGDYDEDDSLLLPPPRSAGLEEEYTARSIEVPRRAASEQIGSRLSRGSFGSIRSDDRLPEFGGFDFNALGEDGVDSSFIPNESREDDYGEDRRYSGIPREDTGTVQLDIPDEVIRRMSDFRRGGLQNDDTDTSFMIAVPRRDDVPENMLNFGAAQEMEDLPFATVEDTIIPGEDDVEEQDDDEEQDDVEDQDLSAIVGHEQEEEEEEVEAEQDLDIEELEDEEQAENPNDTTMTENQDGVDVTAETIAQPKKKPIKISKHGIPVPSLPAGVVKKLATTYARTSGNSKAKPNKDALAAIMQASDWFFEQVADDLGAYSEHAGRRTIDEGDVVALMKRQRQVNATTTPFALAQKYLPRELLQDLRMTAPTKLKKVRRMEVMREEDGEDD